ncbi:MAG: helix-turn-helix transcriptional regulator [Bacillota bacterium]
MKDINKTLGERIKFARSNAKMTRERLAETINVSPRFLADVESGKVGVSIQTLANISKALTVSSDYLLDLSSVYFNHLDSIYCKLQSVDKKYYSLIISILDNLNELTDNT